MRVSSDGLCVCQLWVYLVLGCTLCDTELFQYKFRRGCVSAAQQTFRCWTAVILQRINHHQGILSPGRCNGGLTLHPGDAVCLPVHFGVQVQLCWHHKGSSRPLTLADPCVYCPRGSEENTKVGYSGDCSVSLDLLNPQTAQCPTWESGGSTLF